MMTIIGDFATTIIKNLLALTLLAVVLLSTSMKSIKSHFYCSIVDTFFKCKTFSLLTLI